jgi:hypothetical protein
MAGRRDYRQEGDNGHERLKYQKLGATNPNKIGEG